MSSLLLYITLFLSLFFEIFLLITYFEIKDEIDVERELGNELKRFPSTTIIVPCYNERDTVGKTVNSILNLDYPADRLSVLIVDDGSKDGTYDVVKGLFGENPRVQIFRKENGGKYTALNFALERISTDLVGCLDADSFVDSMALRRIVPHFEDEGISAVIPSIKIHEPKTILQYVQKIEYTWGIFLRRMLASINALYVTPGPFSIFRTKVFRELGGYKHAHHTEDLEMALRMQKSRYRIVNSHSAFVYTIGPAKLKGLYKQRVRWTYGFLNNAFDYRDLFFNKKYGNIGMFVLPMATFSIFTSLYSAGMFLWKELSQIPKYFDKYQAVGFNFGVPHWSFHWYALNTGVIAWITLAILSLTFVILYISLRMAEGKAKFGKEVFYYLTLYIFIVPLWLSKAVYSTIARKDISWK